MAATEISVDHIARVEGHGDIRLVIEDGQVTTCEMAVVEPARLFESMVRGRSFEEVPYIASRVCGICSSSHVVTDLRAIEQVFGVEVTDRTEALRELLLYGSYLQNHGTHLFVFAAPDFLGHKSVFPLAEGNPELFYPSARPMLPPQDYDLAAEVEKHDVLLSYPYQSIRPFIAMLKRPRGIRRSSPLR